MIGIIASGAAHPFEIDSESLDRRDVALRKLGELAVRRACQYTRLLHSPVGIVLQTKFGERYPEQWRQAAAAGKRIRPTQFPAAILNSVAGHCSIVFRLEGPQITVVDGDPFEVAKLQLAAGRARSMVVLHVEEGDTAWAFIVE